MRYGDPAGAVRLLAIADSASVFDDLTAVRQRAQQIPGVHSARITRRLPGTLVVEVDERRPVALAAEGGVLVMIDSSGAVLPFIAAGRSADLPVARQADSAVALLLSRVGRGSPDLYRTIAEAWRTGPDVTVLVDGRRLLFRPDATLEDMRAVKIVAQRLAAQAQPYTELDGRFDGTVIVRGMGS